MELPTRFCGFELLSVVARTGRELLRSAVRPRRIVRPEPGDARLLRDIGIASFGRLGAEERAVAGEIVVRYGKLDRTPRSGVAPTTPAATSPSMSPSP